MARVTFKVNGVQHSVGYEESAETPLVDFLRDRLELRGTKYMCREGSCGTCCVSVVKTPGGPVVSVNACMVSIFSCEGWEITTIEEIGNKKKGYHVIQKTLAEHDGTQCGYCTPAWVGNMYSLLQNKKKLTMLEIEKSFGSNVCRCTGYRPILEAFKKFGSDAPAESRIMDIEDLRICKKNGLSCNKTKCDANENVDDWCMVSDEEPKPIIKLQLNHDKFWYRARDLDSVFDVLCQHGYDDYMLVNGNTAKGPHPIDEYPSVMIDIQAVEELKGYAIDQNLIIGVGITLTELTEVLQIVAKQEYFKYLEKFVEHIELVAGITIKNLGSLGGNLMIKHKHNDFPSDMFLLLETVGAYLTIVSKKNTKILSMQEFLKEDMTGKIIRNAILPPLNEQYHLFTYKTMPRSQNAHAILNAGFLYKLASNNTVLEARIVFGGLSPSFVRAEATEKFLQDKLLFSNSTLQGALDVLVKELVVVDNPPDFSAEYRKQLALSLFYKGLLFLCPSGVLNPRFISGMTKIHETRPVSQSKQTYDTDSRLWPLNQPIHKVEGLIQCAGETKYTNDLQVQPGEVHAALALATVALGDIVKIDASAALKYPGVIAFYTAADIPGVNTFTPGGTTFYPANEEVLASTKVQYFNQAIGIIVAETQIIANHAAKMVTATYANVKEPVTDIKTAKDDPNRSKLFLSIPATDKGTEVVKTIKGQNTIYGQIHFPTESICCVTVPTEEGLACHATTQWMDGCQYVIAKALNIDANRVDVYTGRIGGGFGMKISRPSQIAVACSLVAYKMNRPCRVVVPLTTRSRAIGKRSPCHSDYEVDVSVTGLIQSIKFKQFEDNGYMYNEPFAVLSADVYNNCYTSSKWNFELFDIITDSAKTTWCRAPGSLESIALAEFVIERIAYELNLDPIEVRKINVDRTKYADILNMADELKESASYTERRAKVDQFNIDNRWKKRGLRCSFLRWGTLGSPAFNVNLSVCHLDGTIIITHGGIEMGQGINTKAIQICASLLKIPIDKIKVKGNNTIVAPNCFITGGSLGSQNVGVGVRKCCESLLARLEPTRIRLGNPTWLELIHSAFASDVDLQVHGYAGAADYEPYDVCGVAIAEVEVDILTGESEILRVDLIQDVGQSVSPAVDVGQLEGAFIMGLGYWTSENLVYHKTSGELLTDRAWNYYVPLCRDIPQVFNVSFKKGSYSSRAILGAKGTGEPSICLSVVLGFAIREAIAAGRKEVGIPTTSWFEIDGPYTVEKVNLASGIRKEDFLYT